MNSLLKKLLIFESIFLAHFCLTHEVVKAMEPAPLPLPYTGNGAKITASSTNDKIDNIALDDIAKLFKDNALGLSVVWSNNGDLSIVNAKEESPYMQTVFRFNKQFVCPEQGKVWYKPLRNNMDIYTHYPKFSDLAGDFFGLISLEDLTGGMGRSSFVTMDYKTFSDWNRNRIPGNIESIKPSAVCNIDDLKKLENSLSAYKANTDRIVSEKKCCAGNGIDFSGTHNEDSVKPVYESLKTDYNMSQLCDIQLALANDRNYKIIYSYLTLLGLDGDTFKESPFVEYDNSNGLLTEQFSRIKDTIIGSVVFGRVLFYMFFLSRSYGIKVGNVVQGCQKLKVIYDDKQNFGYKESTDTFNICLAKSSRYRLYDSNVGPICNPQKYKEKSDFNVTIPVFIEELIRTITINLDQNFKNLPKGLQELATWLKKEMTPGKWYYEHFSRVSAVSGREYGAVKSIFLPRLFRGFEDPTDVLKMKIKFASKGYPGRSVFV